MKQKDIVLIIIIIFISAIFSLLISNFLIAPASDRQTMVEVVGPITSEFKQPDKKYFNKKANNPTQIIRIDEYDNNDPFSGARN